MAKIFYKNARRELRGWRSARTAIRRRFVAAGSQRGSGITASAACADWPAASGIAYARHAMGRSDAPVVRGRVLSPASRMLAGDAAGYVAGLGEQTHSGEGIITESWGSTRRLSKRARRTEQRGERRRPMYRHQVQSSNRRRRPRPNWIKAG